jgi:tetratricopeptide (TPR) repeat protein
MPEHSVVRPPRWLWAAVVLGAVAAGGQTDRAEVYFNQGYSYQVGRGVSRDLAKARQQYEEALRYNPDSVPVLYNLGVIYYGQRQYKDAMSFFAKTVKVARTVGDPFAYYEAVGSIGVGSCYQKDGKLREAEQWFRSAVRLQPSLPEAHFNLINLLIRARRFPEAEQAVRVAEKQAPSPNYRLLYGRLKGASGPEEKGVASAVKYVAIGVLAATGLFVLVAMATRGRRRRV